MRPSGPRVRSTDPRDPRQQRQPPSASASSSARPPSGRSGRPADRDQAFASIFGRPAGGHHAAAAPQRPHAGAESQGYPYSQAPPAHVYPHQQYQQAVQPPYRSTPPPFGRSSASSGGYEAFAPPLPPPPPQQQPPRNFPTNTGGPYGRPSASNGGYEAYAPPLPPPPPPQMGSFSGTTGRPSGPHERGSAPAMAMGHAVGREPSSNVYQGYPYEPEALYPARRTSAGTSTTGLAPAFTHINPSGAGLSYENDPSLGLSSRRVSGSSTNGPYGRPQRDDSYSSNPNLVHHNSTTSVRSGSSVNLGRAYNGYETGNSAPSADSPGSMYDSIFENLATNSSTTSLPHSQGLAAQKSNGSQQAIDRACSPPPEYSTYVSHDPPRRSSSQLSGRPRISALTTRSAVPALPDIVRDAEGLRLFDDPVGAERSRLSQRSESSAVSGGQSSGHYSYEDEMRDHVHPVGMRTDVYGARTHRRQMSNSSVISTGSVQSGYALASGATRGSTSHLSSIDSNCGPNMASPATGIADSHRTGATNPARNRLSSGPSFESVRSLPYMSGNQPNSEQRSSYGSFDMRATSFSGPQANRDVAVTAVRTGSLGHAGRFGRSQMSGNYIMGHPSPSSTSVDLATQSSLRSKPPSVNQAGRHRFLDVYPALLSRVAEVFRQHIPLSDRVKDGLSYKDAFDGKEALDLLCDIIRTPDRNLAMLVARSLESQKFFHEVTYGGYRFKGDVTEIYRFKERLPSPFAAAEDGLPRVELDLNTTGVDARSEARPVSNAYSSGSLTSPITSTTASPLTTPQAARNSVKDADADDLGRNQVSSEYPTEDVSLPTGVFILLSSCYSPTCSKDKLCYSVSCPRRADQQRRLNLKVEPALIRKASEESLVEVKVSLVLERRVEQPLTSSHIMIVDDREMRRQEAINELIYTERDFVRDMEYLRDQWIKPLRTNDVIPPAKRESFVTQVFWNTHEILAVNSVFSERLTKRQKHNHIVPYVADIMLEFISQFEPFVVYGAHQLFGKYEFEKEKTNNPAFQKFVDETERNPASRKLELNGYLTKPTTRLARYPLLLKEILKHTPDDNPDKTEIPKVTELIKDFLTRVNEESGKSENMFNLAQLDQQLVFRPGENFDLHLRDKNRQLVFKGPLKCRGGPNGNGENADLLAFLFDHALLLVKAKWMNKQHEQYKVYRKPIPLELMLVTAPEDARNALKGSSSRTGLASTARGVNGKSVKDVIHKPDSKHGFSLTIQHLGRKGYYLTLWAASFAARQNWLEHIDEQQQNLRNRSRVFKTLSLTDRFFVGLNKVNCASPYDGGRRIIYGTDEGVFFSNLRDERLRVPAKVVAIPDVTQVDVLEEFQLLIVLAERSVTAFPLEALDPTDPTAALKRGKRLSSHTSFFKCGVCLGRVLLCIVKSSSLSSTIKVLEPVDMSQRGKKEPTPFRKLLNNSGAHNEPFHILKEFYIPTESTSLMMLKTKLCVATTRGFEVIDLETLDTQSLLDPSDSSLDFVAKRENVRPVTIYRIEEFFLLCYAEFAFYVNKTGWRARPRWAIQWEGVPTSFALHYPYILAFEPTFVEVRHVDTGHLVQIIPGNHIRCLFADAPPSQIHTPQGPLIPFRNVPGGAPPHPGYGGPAYGHPPPNNPYGPPRPAGPPPSRIRNQIIFVSDEGNVQVVRLAPPGPTPPRVSQASSISRR
ncbi:hypothetical protein QFC22_001404 [Naganishia vaughanmartiniae]|uniref:Uncharacterized protein n=1 Tax=Naganishia vaughanmartiniae TaxID=1424756 RepID=A0ACC2XII5_9TREE|nr:hypothetical protein QFC22_001404 [Naganishia vaughanmartiniae]